MNIARCDWGNVNDNMRAYHDEEWGVPVHDDRRLFEFIVLDAFQAGISWAIVLNKRQAFRRAFDQFDILTVAGYGEDKFNALMEDAGIVRNRLKIQSAITSARAALDVQAQFGSLDSYLWRFVDGHTLVNTWKTMQEIPAISPQSDAMSKDLKQRGFKFVGSTICYAFMQAAGLVNDHLVTCFRYHEV